MQHLSGAEKLGLSRCCRLFRRVADHPFAWKHATPIGPLPLSRFECSTKQQRVKRDCSLAARRGTFHVNLSQPDSTYEINSLDRTYVTEATMCVDQIGKRSLPETIHTIYLDNALIEIFQFDAWTMMKFAANKLPQHVQSIHVDARLYKYHTNTLFYLLTDEGMSRIKNVHFRFESKDDVTLFFSFWALIGCFMASCPNMRVRLDIDDSSRWLKSITAEQMEHFEHTSRMEINLMTPPSPPSVSSVATENPSFLSRIASWFT